MANAGQANFNDKRITIVEKISETKICDTFVILTEWEEFKYLDWAKFFKIMRD